MDDWTQDADTDGIGDAGSSLVEADAVSVAEARALGEGAVVTVKGYYVGFVNGTSLGKAVFVKSLSVPNTNLLLADDEFCDDETVCLPVELPPGVMRECLNTFDHPELHKKPLLIRGMLSTYFRVKGLRDCDAWQVLADNEEGSDPTEEPEPDVDPTPDLEPQPDLEKLDLPQIDYSAIASRAR